MNNIRSTLFSFVVRNRADNRTRIHYFTHIITENIPLHYKSLRQKQLHSEHKLYEPVSALHLNASTVHANVFHKNYFTPKQSHALYLKFISIIFQNNFVTGFNFSLNSWNVQNVFKMIDHLGKINIQLVYLQSFLASRIIQVWQRMIHFVDAYSYNKTPR